MNEIAIAVTIGIAFGFALERAGLGDATKLAGQFYFTDLTVFKVMFSAIVTAMLGAFWLSRLGVIDLRNVYVPETFLVPQLAGGALFGAGFLLAGLCPGTGCVAAASGRGDGAVVMAGMFGGVLVTGLLVTPSFYASTARGALTIPQLTGAGYGVVVCVVVAMALAMFAVLAERRMGAGVPLGAVAMIAGALALFAGSPYRTPERIDAIQLAQWIHDRKPDLHVIDLRDEASFDEYHVPTSRRGPIPASGTVVLITDGKTAAKDHPSVDIGEWVAGVMNPTLPENAPADQVAAFEKASVLSRYFGGLPRRTNDKANKSTWVVRRRGC